MASSQTRQETLDFLRHHPVSHMATVENNRPFSRVMWTVRVDDDFTLWYISPASSHKMNQVEKNPAVCLTVYDAAKDARVFGLASVVNDEEIKDELWKEEWKMYFPKGRQDPEYQLIRIEPTAVEYRDLKTLGMDTANVV